jgi:endonuclease III
MEQLLRGILSDYASEQKANGALGRLRETAVDLNDLRVTPVAEIVRAIGIDYPQVRRAAEDVSRALIGVFNRQHHLDLTHLKRMTKRAAESFFESAGINPHAAATILMRCLKGHAVPADQTMCEFLRRSGIVPPDATAAEIQQFLLTRIKERQAGLFYVQLKRYAATHMPRQRPAPAPRPAEKTDAVAETQAATGAAKTRAAAKPPGRSTATLKKLAARRRKEPTAAPQRRRHR